jgi:hypothetical protein
MLQGFFGAMLKGERQLDDHELRRFIRAYQRRILFRGRAKAMAQTEALQAPVFDAAHPA